MTESTDVLKRESEATKKYFLYFKELSSDNRKERDHCHYMGLCGGAAHSSFNLKYWILYYIPIVFHNLSSYDAHLFIKELGEKFNIDDAGVIAEKRKITLALILRLRSSWHGWK